MNENEVKFGLRKITTKQFATFDSVDVSDDSISLNFGFGFGINEELRIFGCHSRFEFLSNGVPFIILHVTCEFEIEQESWKGFVSNDSKLITFPLQIVTHMAVLTVGTARGVLHCKTENTKFNKYFLPTINVTESLQSDIIFELKN